MSSKKVKFSKINRDDAVGDDKTMIQHLEAAITYYECLQNDDGWLPGR